MSTTSFLPEDYLDQMAERRTNLISLTLFGIVMVSVFAAFLVTNRQWSEVKKARTEINAQYEELAVQIERLNELEAQKDQMLNKARLAAALVERVPRSILLAELINHMPERLGLLELALDSKKIKPVKARPQRQATRGRLRGPMRAMTREEAARRQQEEDKVDVPRYDVNLTLVGVAPTDVEVSRYIARLNAHPLLQDVTLEYSEEREVEGDKMRRFEITMKLNPDMDARDLDPLRGNKIEDPLVDDRRVSPPRPAGTAGLSRAGDGG